jgi:hypothetical protein
LIFCGPEVTNHEKIIISLLGVGAFEFSLFSQVENKQQYGITYDNLYAVLDVFQDSEQWRFESSVLEMLILII